MKNEKRREKKRLEAGDKAWDEDSDDEGHVGGHADGSGGAEFEPRVDGPIPSEESFPPLAGPSSVANTGAGNGAPTPVTGLETKASSIPSSKPADGGVATPPTQSMDAVLNPPPTNPAGPASATELAPPPDSFSSSSTLSASAVPASAPAKPKAKRHPIQGGRDGPLGLAHPPPPEETRSDKGQWRKDHPKKAATANKSAKAGQAKQNAPKALEEPVAKPEPRIRKEVKVREGGMNAVGSLASRVRNLVLDNQTPPRSRAKKEEAAETASEVKET